MKRSLLIVTVCFFIINILEGQKRNLEYAGYYSDKKSFLASDILILNEDGTFIFTTLDPEFGVVKSYENKGTWVSNNQEVFLNPEKEKREKEIILENESKDTLSKEYFYIKINYILKEFEKEVYKRERNYNFDILRIYFNESTNMYIAKRNPKVNKSGEIKSSKVLEIDKDNIIKIEKEKYNLNQITKITIDGFGYRKELVVQPKETESNYVEISIIHPIDVERTPRNKKIIIKGKKAYIHEYSGIIDESLFSMPLKKRKRI